MAAVTVTPSSPAAGSLPTIAGSALTASTVYVVTYQPAGVSWIGEFKVKTDGSGAFSVPMPLPATQYGSTTWTVNVYSGSPVAESSVTTLPTNISALSAAATTTFTATAPTS